MTSIEAVRLAYAKGYRVTSDGRVISHRGKVLKLQENDSGYLWFKPTSECPPVRAHRLQAFQSFGEAMFADGIECRHLDGNQKNNSAENIALGTRSQNQMDRPAADRRRCAIAASRCAQKHDHSAISRRLAEGASYGVIQREFGIRSKGAISFIARQSLTSRGGQ